LEIKNIDKIDFIETIWKLEMELTLLYEKSALLSYLDELNIFM
jgi:hypothetical protein